MSFDRFISELKQRNVLRVAGVYTVVAWGVFTIAKTVLETLDYPKVVQVWILGLAALGLPVAVGLSWIYERGPDGKIRRARSHAEGAPYRKLSWLDWGILGAMAAVLAILIASAVGLSGSLSGQGIAGGAARKSVAVLPFDSFSNVQDTEYFADGLTEEVINSLAQVPDLKVAGRTSAFYFKNKDEDLREIGRKLNVAHVVEGSVRRDGDRLRVTAQLIRASNGYHLWSETYDRTMDDAFAIQTEIAESVAEALKAELKVGGGLLAARKDPEAYADRLTALGKLGDKGKANVLQAQEIFRRLAQKDPNDADAHAYLAFSTAYLAQNHLEGDFLPAIREAEREIDIALKLDPRSAAAYLAKGMVGNVRFIRESRQSAEAEALAAYQRAAELAPKNAEALGFYGNYLVRVRRPSEAIEVLQRAVEIDPLANLARVSLAQAYAESDRMEDAIQLSRVNVELFPAYVECREQLAELLIEQGRYAEAVPWIRKAAEPLTDPASSITLANLYYNLGMPAEAEAALVPWKDHPIMGPLAQVVQAVVDDDWPRVLAISQAELAKNDADPLWRSGTAYGAAMTGRFDLAREQLLITSPQLFDPTPEVVIRLSDETVNSAFVIERTDPAQARRVLAAVLAVTEPKPGLRQHSDYRIARMKAFAMLGEREKALAELRAAIDHGFRRVYDLEIFLRIDRHPTLASLHRDPRFIAMVREMEAANVQQRQLLQQGPTATVAKK